MQNDETPAAKNKKIREDIKRCVVVGLLFFAELVIMYVIQNVHGCGSIKATFVGLFVLAISLVAFFVSVNLFLKKSKK